MEGLKDNSQFKNMRHVETVRNYLNVVIQELMRRQEQHDQTKFQSPEIEIFEKYTPKLRGATYMSPEYKRYAEEMKPALEHHYMRNRHHPECFANGIKGMTLIDLIEMLCDWLAASLRHGDGDIHKSIRINQDRFGYTVELMNIFKNTAHWLNSLEVPHHAEES